MPRLQCPRCETTIEAPEKGQPVCPACGFSAPYEGAGDDETPGGSGFQEDNPSGSSGGYSQGHGYGQQSGQGAGQGYGQEYGQGAGQGYGSGQGSGYGQPSYGTYTQPYGSEGGGPSSQGYGGGAPGGAAPGYPAQQPQQGYGAAQHGPPGKTSGMAVASMILGIIAICLVFIVWVPVLGWFSFGPAVIAIILGGVALSQMNRDPTLQGRGMAVAGLVLGIIVAAIGLIFRVMFLGL